MKTTIQTKITVLFVCVTLFMCSCKNETEVINLKNIPTAAAFEALRLSSLEDLKQTQAFNAENGVTFSSKNGTTIAIDPNCMQTQDGETVTGSVNLTFVEMYDRGNMALTNKPLMGKDNEGNLLPLITGGQYNLKITQGSNELKSGCYFNVVIPTELTGGVDNDMKLWNGTIDEEGNLIWEEQDDQKEGLGTNDMGTHYNIWGNTFGWTNIDRFYSDVRPKTKIKVSVPDGYNNTNSGVYIAYEGEPNVLAQLDVYNVEEDYFSEHYGFIPVDLNVHVIFVSENNGSVAYSIKTVKIIQNATISIQDSDIKTTSKAQLITLINNLN